MVNLFPLIAQIYPISSFIYFFIFFLHSIFLMNINNCTFLTVLYVGILNSTDVYAGFFLFFLSLLCF